MASQCGASHAACTWVRAHESVVQHLRMHSQCMCARAHTHSSCARRGASLQQGQIRLQSFTKGHTIWSLTMRWRRHGLARSLLQPAMDPPHRTRSATHRCPGSRLQRRAGRPPAQKKEACARPESQASSSESLGNCTKCLCVRCIACCVATPTCACTRCARQRKFCIRRTRRK